MIVCDREIVEEFFEYKQRPLSAQQADATWDPKYMLESALVNERVVPIFYLGTRYWYADRLTSKLLAGYTLTLILAPGSHAIF